MKKVGFVPSPLVLILGAGVAALGMSFAQAEEIPAETEGQIGRIVESLKEKRAEFESAAMKEVIERIQKVTGLSDPTVIDALEDASREAVKASEAAWLEAYARHLRWMARDFKAQSGDEKAVAEMLAYMERGDERAEERATLLEMGPEVRATATEIWKSALRRHLDAEALATWEAVVERELETREAFLEEAAQDWVQGFEPSLGKRFAQMCDEVITGLRLDKGRAEAIRAGAKGAQEAALKELHAMVRTRIEVLPEGILNEFSAARGGDDFVREATPMLRAWGWTGVDPSQASGWQHALAELLTENETERLAQIRADGEAAEAVERRERENLVLNALSDRQRPSFRKGLDDQVHEISASIRLDDERMKRLRERADALLDETMRDWEEAARAHLAAMPVEERDRWLDRGYLNVRADAVTPPIERKAWKQFLGTLLTDEEKANWESSTGKREITRREVFAEVLLGVLDSHARFRAEQRRDLMPTLTGIVEEEVLPKLEEPHAYIDFHGLLREIRKPEVSEAMERTLTSLQREGLALFIEQQLNRNPTIDLSKDSSLGALELENASKDQIETAISLFLDQRMAMERRFESVPLRAEIEMLDAVAGLRPEQRERLETAAKGAVEEELSELSTTMMHYLRRAFDPNQGQGRTIQDRLNTVGRFRVPAREASSTGIWRETIAGVLDSDQIAVWEAAASEQERWRNEVTTQFVLSRLDDALFLSGEQREAFREQLSGILGDYSEAMDAIFSHHQGGWCFSGNYAVLPVAGIPQKTFEEMLTDEQREVWRTKFGDLHNGIWQSVLHKHRQLKQRKE